LGRVRLSSPPLIALADPLLSSAFLPRSADTLAGRFRQLCCCGRLSGSCGHHGTCIRLSSSLLYVPFAAFDATFELTSPRFGADRCFCTLFPPYPLSCTAVLTSTLLRPPSRGTRTSSGIGCVLFSCPSHLVFLPLTSLVYRFGPTQHPPSSDRPSTPYPMRRSSSSSFKPTSPRLFTPSSLDRSFTPSSFLVRRVRVALLDGSEQQAFLRSWQSP
jgi:hypothetical protein